MKETQARLEEIEKEKEETEARLAEEQTKREEEELKRQESEKMRLEAEKERAKAEELRRQAEIKAQSQPQIRTVVVNPSSLTDGSYGTITGSTGSKKYSIRTGYRLSCSRRRIHW